MNTVNTISGTIVKAALQGLRVPLTTVELATHNSGSNWTPAVLFESFEAQAKKVLGSFLRNDDLIREGRLQQAKVGDLTEAERLQSKAEVKRQEADAVLEARKQSAEESRLRAEKQAAQRKQQLDREEAEKKRVIAEKARRQKENAASAAHRRGETVSAQERRAERIRVAKELAASTKRRRAVSAAKRAKDLETALETKKAQRKSA